LSHTTLQKQLHAFCACLYKPIADRLGWEAKPDESHLETLLRSLVFNRLVSNNCPVTIEEAKKRFKLHSTGQTLLPADMRTPCYKAVMQNGDLATYEEMLRLYRASDLHEEKDRISRALGSFKDVEILKKVVEFALSKEVRAQDSVFVIVSVAMNPNGRDMTWEFFKSNSAKLLEQYEGGFLLARLVKYLTENFASEERAQEVEKYFQANIFQGTERTVSQSVETIRLNAAWLQRDLPSVTEFFNSHNNC